jgi:hypothetical protein
MLGDLADPAAEPILEEFTSGFGPIASQAAQAAVERIKHAQKAGGGSAAPGPAK